MSELVPVELLGRPREYQPIAHDCVFREWGIEPYYKGSSVIHKRTLLEIGTGGGKTVVAAMMANTIVKELGERMLFVADSDELCQQPIEKIKAWTGIRPGLEKAEFLANLDAPIVVASAQSLSPERLARFPRDHFKFILNDECDRGTERYKRINDHFGDPRVVGLTATAFRAGLKDLKKWYSSVAYSKPAFREGGLIEQAYLSPLEIMTLDIEADLRAVEVDERTGDYDETQLANVMRPLMRTVCQRIRDDEQLQPLSILVYCPLISSSLDFVRIACSEGLTAQHIDGDTKDRLNLINEFEAGKFQLLSNAAVLNRGVDLLNCDAMLNLCPTRSKAVYRQRVGRILRVPAGVIDGVLTSHERLAAIKACAKPKAFVIDLLCQFGKLGLADPAGLILDDETEIAAAREMIRKMKTPAELEEIRRAIQAEREQKVLDDWKKVKNAGAGLMSVEVFASLYHDSRIRDYEPFSEADALEPTKKTKFALGLRGIDPTTVKTRGLAELLIEKIDSCAPPHSWDMLRARGHNFPHRMTLDEAIRELRGEFPMGFGRFRGDPLSSLEREYWVHLFEEYTAGKKWLDRWPAEKRYMRKVIALGSQSAVSH